MNSTFGPLVIATAASVIIAALLWCAYGMLCMGIRIGRREGLDLGRAEGEAIGRRAEGDRIIRELNSFNCVNFQTSAHHVAALLRSEQETTQMPALREPPGPRQSLFPETPSTGARILTPAAAMADTLRMRM